MFFSVVVVVFVVSPSVFINRTPRCCRVFHEFVFHLFGKPETRASSTFNRFEVYAGMKRRQWSRESAEIFILLNCFGVIFSLPVLLFFFSTVCFYFKQFTPCVFCIYSIEILCVRMCARARNKPRAIVEKSKRKRSAEHMVRRTQKGIWLKRLISI